MQARVVRIRAAWCERRVSRGVKLDSHGVNPWSRGAQLQLRVTWCAIRVSGGGLAWREIRVAWCEIRVAWCESGGGEPRGAWCESRGVWCLSTAHPERPAGVTQSSHRKT
eukprot:480671-Prorocentrum_minimum.AAC.4